VNVGIDLGTSYSLVARLQEDGAAALMPDYAQHDIFHTPSVVAFRRDDAYVGRLAEMLLDDEPHVTALRFFKRRLGDPEPMYYASNGAGWRAEGIAALVLKKLRYDGETFGRTPVAGAVLTVPAHFTDPQRRAVLGAALLADLPVLGLLEEPVAAALHYGATAEPRDRVILVFDWGGGTFDVTVVGATPSSLSVLAKRGANDLGGKEVDDAVAALILEAIPPGTFAGSLGARALLDLSRAAEEIKIDLAGPGRPGP
jgi:molecular chaperone DnaK